VRGKLRQRRTAPRQDRVHRKRGRLGTRSQELQGTAAAINLQASAEVAGVDSVVVVAGKFGTSSDIHLLQSVAPWGMDRRLKKPSGQGAIDKCSLWSEMA
jgi:hypothetical protein